jgi:hypothetical protein
VPGSGKEAPKVLPWVHTLIANIKGNIRGIHHGVSPKQLPRYLAEFCYRFNRRFWEPQMFNRMLHACLNSNTITFLELRTLISLSLLLPSIQLINFLRCILDVLSLEIIGDYVRFALATSEVAPDLAHELRLIPRALPPQSIAFDTLVEQFVRVDLRTIVGEKN